MVEADKMTFDHLYRELSRLGDEVVTMRKATTELVLLGERQNTTLAQIKTISDLIIDHEKRLREIEVKQPQLIEARSWVLIVAAVVISSTFQYFAGKLIQRERSTLPPQAAIVDKRNPYAFVH